MTTQTVSTGARARPAEKNDSGRRRRFPWLKSIVTLILIPVCALSFFPFVWLILTSLRTQDSVLAGPFWPQSFSLVAYGEAWNSIGFALHFTNSLVITVATVIGVLIFSTISGYAFAILKFPFKNVIYLALLTTLFMPATALIIPLYLQLKNLGLLNSQAGLIVLYVSSSAPFAMFLMRAFFQTLPDDLVQAARIDGAGEFTIFWRIILPLARPGIATVVIFQFLSTWNEFLYANTVIQDTGKLPLQPVLFSLIGQYSTNWPDLTAGLTMSIVPVVIVYVFMQRQFVAGLTLGAVKS
jgi:ABC-type glycerol-3-phosphate transport system permease component